MAALLPEWAIHCAYLAAMGAMVVYATLALARQEDEGVPGYCQAVIGPRWP